MNINIITLLFLILSSNLFYVLMLVNSSENKKSINLYCNPYNKGLVTNWKEKIWIRQWLNARMELGLKDYNQIELYSGHYRFNNNGNNLQKYVGRFQRRIADFYSETSPNGVVVYNCLNYIIPYARILKCGSEGIAANLELFCSTISNNKNKKKIVFKKDYDSQSKLNMWLGGNSTDVFTFVRDPFEHFVSGFVESVWGTYGDIKGQDGYLKRLNVSQVKSLFDELLLFNYTKLWPLNGFKHLFPMSNIFFKFDIHIVGQLESFENDWNQKIRPAYNISQRYVKSFGQHPTSVNHPFAQQEIQKKSKPTEQLPKNSDPNNARKALLDLFRQDVRYKKMVCQLILVDYVCLPMYRLPEECQYLNETVNEVRESINNKVQSEKAKVTVLKNKTATIATKHHKKISPAMIHRRSLTSSSASVCNPESSAKIDVNFLLSLWARARGEVGMSNSSANTFEDMKKNWLFCSKVSQFHSKISRSGVTAYQLGPSAPIVAYARILKCGSENIDGNMLASLTATRKSMKPLKASDWKQEFFSQSEFYNRFPKNETNIPIFAFVRNPLEHFISGFTEAAWASYHTKQYKNDDGSYKQLNMSSVKSLLDDLLHIGVSKMWINNHWPLEGFQHTFPMSNIFFKFDIHIVGQLESFENDWNQKIRPAYNISQRYVKSLGQHPTSVNHPFAQQEIQKKSKSTEQLPKNSDPNNARKALLDLFRQDVRYKKMVCQLILVDYVCLPMYRLPEECQYLNETVNEVRESIKNL